MKAVSESIREPESTNPERSRWVKIMNADYKTSDFEDIVNKVNSSNKEKIFLQILLNEYTDLFGGSLGDINVHSIKLEVKEGTEPVHSRPFSVPHIHKETIYKKLQCMVALNILEKSSCSAWDSSTFIIPEADGTVRMVLDYRKSNDNLIKIPYHIPKVSGIM